MAPSPKHVFGPRTSSETTAPGRSRCTRLPFGREHSPDHHRRRGQHPLDAHPPRRLRQHRVAAGRGRNPHGRGRRIVAAHGGGRRAHRQVTSDRALGRDDHRSRPCPRRRRGGHRRLVGRRVRQHAPRPRDPGPLRHPPTGRRQRRPGRDRSRPAQRPGGGEGGQSRRALLPRRPPCQCEQPAHRSLPGRLPRVADAGGGPLQRARRPQILDESAVRCAHALGRPGRRRRQPPALGDGPSASARPTGSTGSARCSTSRRPTETNQSGWHRSSRCTGSRRPMATSGPSRT